MKSKKKIRNRILFVALLMLSFSCEKEFLDTKPAMDLNVPTSLADMQLLLDNTSLLNRSPAIGEESADDYYMTADNWKNQYAKFNTKIYIWAKDIWEGSGGIEDWNKPYTQVLYANVVLEQLNKLERTSLNSVEYDNIKGSVLFLRAWSFFDIAQVFALPYDSNSAITDLGIPLRLTSDINETLTRFTMKETYEQILRDATQAADLLTIATSPQNGNRPSKAAAFGLLSRIHLTMRDYVKAGFYADNVLQISNTLMDYNTLDTTATTPFTYDNPEVIYQNYVVDCEPLIYLGVSPGYSIDTLLYKSYEVNDLRKYLYFKDNQGYVNKKGLYSGSIGVSNGIATDEMLITRAECYARNGNLDAALKDLNDLLVTRWESGTYTTYETSDGNEALNKILLERRKELVLRGLRWNDIRRLNKEGYNITLTRVLDGETYTLPPNDPRYALPIPPDVISVSGFSQNNR